MKDDLRHGGPLWELYLRGIMYGIASLPLDDYEQWFVVRAPEPLRHARTALGSGVVKVLGS